MSNVLSAYNDLIKENDGIYRALFKRLGLSPCTFWIMYTLREERSVTTQTGICEILHEPKQTVNSALKNLEAEGFITLSYGQDRRSKCVSLTEKGVNAAEKLTEILRRNDIRELTIVRMDVPCCGGMQRAAETALRQSGKFIPWQVVTLGRDGNILE